MPKTRTKSDLPTKICVVCGLPSIWRGKWVGDWDRVTHCSYLCLSASKAKPARAGMQ